MSKVCDWLAAKNRLLTRRVKELENQFQLLQSAMIEVQSDILGVKIMENTMDKMKMESLLQSTAKTHCFETNEPQQETSNGKAEMPPLIGTNSLPLCCATAVENGGGTAKMQCLETNGPHEKTLNGKAEMPPFIGTNSLSQCNATAVESGEGDGEKNCDDVNTLLVETDDGSGPIATSSWEPKSKVTRASCNLGDGEESDDGSGTIANSSWETKSKMKHVSFNLDDGKVFEKYVQRTMYGCQELLSDDDMDDYDVPESLRWFEGTLDVSEVDEDDLQTILFLDLLRQRQMEQEFMKENEKRNGGDSRQKGSPYALPQNALDKTSTRKKKPYATRRVRPHR